MTASVVPPGGNTTPHGSTSPVGLTGPLSTQPQAPDSRKLIRLQVLCLAAGTIGWLFFHLHRNPAFFLLLVVAIWWSANRQAHKAGTTIHPDRQLILGLLSGGAVLLALVMLAMPNSPLDHTSSASVTPPVATGNLPPQPAAALAQPPAGHVPAAVPTPPADNEASQVDLDNRLIAWDAKVPASASHQPQPADSNDTWRTDINYWLSYATSQSDVTYADGVVRDVPGLLYPTGSPAPSPQLSSHGQWLSGGTGSPDRLFQGTVTLSNGDTNVYDVAFHFYVDPNGRGHVLIRLQTGE